MYRTYLKTSQLLNNIGLNSGQIFSCEPLYIFTFGLMFSKYD